MRFPRLRVLVLSMRDESVYAERALRAGAHGYIAKEEGTARVIDGLRTILKGDIYLSERMSGRMLRSMLPGHRGASGALPTDLLSDRELEVLELIGTGLGTSEVAAKLHLSVKTIESYRERLKQKLALPDAAELLKYAIQWIRSQSSP